MTTTEFVTRKPRHRFGFGWNWVRLVSWTFLLVPAWGGEPLDAPVPGDDATYRPTVMVRKGTALGTGTIIGSVEGETLILTAAHVVDDPGPLFIELYRYNLGWERTGSPVGFPRRLPATLAARDRAADLAILRVRGQRTLPYVIRIAPPDLPLAAGTPVTSIGFDRGERLVGYWSQVRRVDRIDMEHGGGDRPFLITDHPPEVGRSGGGLFLTDGTLVGVCIARAQLRPGLVRGMYSTVGNVWDLLGRHEKLAAVVARSSPVVALAKPVPRAKLPQNNRTGDRRRANEKRSAAD